MQIRKYATALVAGALGISMLAAHAGAETPTFPLTGDQEVGADAGDPNGAAIAHFHIAQTYVEGEQPEIFCAHLEVKESLTPSEITGLHVHAGERGENGPVVVNLSEIIPEDFTGTEGDVIDDCVELEFSTADVVLDSRERFAGEFYLNLHSEAYPAGALRGQVKGDNYNDREEPGANAGRSNR